MNRHSEDAADHARDELKDQRVQEYAREQRRRQGGKTYDVGDVVTFIDLLGFRRMAIVKVKLPNVRGNSPGFEGVTTPGGADCWAFDCDVVDVLRTCQVCQDPDSGDLDAFGRCAACASVEPVPS